MAKDKAAQRTADDRYDRTHAALHANSEKEKAAGIREETDEYLKLNKAAYEASQNPNLSLRKKLFG